MYKVENVDYEYLRRLSVDKSKNIIISYDAKSQKRAFKNLENTKRCAGRVRLRIFDSNER